MRRSLTWAVVAVCVASAVQGVRLDVPEPEPLPVAVAVVVAVPMQVVAWNYTPDPAVSRVRPIVTAYLDYRRIPGDWTSHWDQRRITFYIGPDRATDREAADELRTNNVLTWVHPYHSQHVIGAPAQFSSEDIAGHKGLVREARSRLRAAGLSDARLRDVRHVLDFENDGPFFRSAFPLASGEHVWGTSVSHLSTCCYLFGDALRAANWNQSARGNVANYMTNHTATRRLYGAEPYKRTTPHWVPGSANADTIFIAGYWTGGPFGCYTEAELADVIVNTPADVRLWLVLEDNNPGLLRLLKLARDSGLVELVLLWGCGYPDDATPGAAAWRAAVGNAYRGGDPAWETKQDRAIAEACGLLK